MPETSTVPSVLLRAKCYLVNTVMPLYVIIFIHICTFVYIHVSVCVCACAPHSPTFSDPSARHLEPPLPLSLTHRIYLQYPPPSLPKRCHSHARLTADIIKAVWPPDMLLAQSRNADRHRATWALAQECQYGWYSECVLLYVYLFNQEPITRCRFHLNIQGITD